MLTSLFLAMAECDRLIPCSAWLVRNAELNERAEPELIKLG